MALTTEELKLIIKAEAKAAANELRQFERQEKSTMQATTGMQKAFATMRDVMQGPVAAFKLLGQGLQEVDKLIMGAVESEKAWSNLSSVLKSTGGVSGMTMASLDALTSELERMTLFEDEAITQSEAVLLTFKSIGKDAFPQATKAIADMATVMKMDLQSATVLVGKALNDPIKGLGALRRVGVQLTDEQTKQVKQFMSVNDVMSAQKVILGELNSQFGGAAAAAANTATGSYLQLKKAVGETGEAFGFLIANLSMGPEGATLADFFWDLAQGVNQSTIAMANAKNIDEINRKIDALEKLRDKTAKNARKGQAGFLSAGGEKAALAIEKSYNDQIRKLIDERSAIEEKEFKKELRRGLPKITPSVVIEKEDIYEGIKLYSDYTKEIVSSYSAQSQAMAYINHAVENRIRLSKKALAALNDIALAYSGITAENKQWTEATKEQDDFQKTLASTAVNGFVDIGKAFGNAIVENSEKGWKAFGQAGLDAIAAVAEAFGAQYAGLAAAKWLESIANPLAIPAAAGYTAAAAGLYAAAGGIRAIPMAQGGSGTVTKPTLFLAGEAGPEDYAFTPKSKGGNKPLTVQVFVSGNVMTERQLDAHIIGAVAKYSRGY